MKTAKIDVSGMHCASCASNLERSMKKVRGVKNVNVALLLKKCRVECEDSVKEEELRQAVKRAGYIPEKVVFE
jgi:P-type Cu+ transporter